MEMVTVAEGTVSPDGFFLAAEVEPGTIDISAWNGKSFSYIPPNPLPIPPAVSLHDEFDRDLDPVTFQVVRSRLWHLNLEQADTIKRVSGTPIVCHADDYNTSLTTENGDIVL